MMKRDTSSRISLAGQRILITRPQAQSEALGALLVAADAEVVVLPLLEVHGLRTDELPINLKKIEQKQYDTLLFTSANAVRFFLTQASELGYDATFLKEQQIYALGRQTQEQLNRLGCASYCDDRVRSSEDFLRMLINAFADALPGQHFFWPRALRVRDVLAQGLREQGAQCSECVVYETLAIKTEEPLPEHLDWVVFSSPSAIDAFVNAFSTLPKVHYACIGEVSARRLQEEGVSCHVIAKEPSNEGLVAAIIDYLCQ
ncbi:MAG: uroporphyrinogen-III synthase [Myxococcota bacterium]|jgi:uroporphyrinogen-III synthase|nr:uroporphyrinogen-III synthase [Myxococcota bacterium]